MTSVLNGKPHILCIAVLGVGFLQMGCGSTASSSQKLENNQMYNRQTAGQDRARQEKNDFLASVTTQSSGSTQATGLTANGVVTAPQVGATAMSYQPKSQGNLASAILGAAVVGGGALLLSPSIKSGLKSILPKSSKASSSPEVKSNSSASISANPAAANTTAQKSAIETPKLNDSTLAANCSQNFNASGIKGIQNEANTIFQKLGMKI